MIRVVLGMALVVLGGVAGVLVRTSSPNGGTLLAAVLIVVGVVIAATAADERLERRAPAEHEHRGWDE